MVHDRVRTTFRNRATSKNGSKIRFMFSGNFQRLTRYFYGTIFLNPALAELIYTCKMIQPVIFSRFNQPVYFSRFKPDNLLLSTARFSGNNLEKCTG